MQRIYQNGEFVGYVCKKHGVVHGIHAPKFAKRNKKVKKESDLIYGLKFAGVITLAWIVLIILAPMI